MFSFRPRDQEQVWRGLPIDQVHHAEIEYRRSLEELRRIFDISTREHIRYRVTYVAPWLWRKLPRLMAAKVLSWLKPKAKGDTQGDVEKNIIDADVEAGFLDFCGWYRGEIYRREIEAQAADD